MDTSRREEIIDAFIKISSRKGLDNTTMQDLAKEVGISVGTIYLSFKNKEELIDAFTQRIFQEMDFYIAEAFQRTVAAVERLHYLTAGNVAFMSKHVRQNQSLFDLFHNDVIKHVRKKDLREKRQQLESERIKVIEKVLEQGLEEGSFNITDVPQTAKLIFIAFTNPHFIGPDILDTEHEELVADAEAMYQFLLKSIKNS